MAAKRRFPFALGEKKACDHALAVFERRK
jgi:hypothetical protein